MVCVVCVSVGVCGCEVGWAGTPLKVPLSQKPEGRERSAPQDAPQQLGRQVLLLFCKPEKIWICAWDN